MTSKNGMLINKNPTKVKENLGFQRHNIPPLNLNKIKFNDPLLSVKIPTSPSISGIVLETQSLLIDDGAKTCASPYFPKLLTLTDKFGLFTNSASTRNNSVSNTKINFKKSRPSNDTQRQQNQQQINGDNSVKNTPRTLNSDISEITAETNIETERKMRFINNLSKLGIEDNRYRLNELMNYHNELAGSKTKIHFSYIPIDPLIELKRTNPEKFEFSKGKTINFRLNTAGMIFPLTIKMISFQQDEFNIQQQQQQKRLMFDLYVSERTSHPTKETSEKSFRGSNFIIDYPHKLERLFLAFVPHQDCQVFIWTIFGEKGKKIVESRKKREQMRHDSSEVWLEKYKKYMDNMEQRKKTSCDVYEFTTSQKEKILGEIEIIKNKRKLRIINLAKGSKDLVKSNINNAQEYSKDNTLKHIRFISTQRKQKVQNALYLKEKVDRENLIKKFLSSYKHEIKKNALDLVKGEVVQQKKQEFYYSNWITLMYSINIAYKIYNDMQVYKAKMLIINNMNNSARKIQQAYKNYMRKLCQSHNKSSYKRHTFAIILGYSLLSQDFYTIKARKILQETICDSILSIRLLNSIDKFMNPVHKLQKSLKSYLIIRSNKLALCSLFIQDYLKKYLFERSKIHNDKNKDLSKKIKTNEPATYLNVVRKKEAFAEYILNNMQVMDSFSKKYYKAMIRKFILKIREPQDFLKVNSADNTPINGIKISPPLLSPSISILSPLNAQKTRSEKFSLTNYYSSTPMSDTKQQQLSKFHKKSLKMVMETDFRKKSIRLELLNKQYLQVFLETELNMRMTRKSKTINIDQ